MKVLVTGITGFVGSHLADYILEHHAEVEVHGTKRWRSPLNNISGIISRIKLHDCDLRDLSSLIHLFEEIKPDVIFHLAAQSFVPTSFTAPVDTLENNIIGTTNLLEAVRFSKIDPVIHICSSSEVYGQVESKDLPITEDCPFHPASPYAVSKVGEDMIGYMYFVAYGLKIIRTRMFTHTGPRRGDLFVTSAFAKQIAQIEKGLQKPEIRVGNLESVRTFADVRDVVRAYWLLVEKCSPGEVYNIGGTATMTVGEMLDKMIAIAKMKGKLKIKVDRSLLRPADVTLQIPCIKKFQKATGWKSEIPFEKTISDLLDYWRRDIDQMKAGSCL
ncbi:GDP-mannose 4,6-dehydratase [bacterium]|nr:GDP-mannose 4,6-dehydratase [bacterium]MBU4133818.1 GDP-mannose 4,6-dehydratase [bacterium]